MQTETREIYKCDHCRKVYQMKHACIAHEPKCKKNPDNKMKCHEGCRFLEKKEVKFSYDAWDGEHESKMEILFCTAKKEGVYPYWVNGLNEDDIHEDIKNNPMPKECDKYKFYEC